MRRRHGPSDRTGVVERRALLDRLGVRLLRSRPSRSLASGARMKPALDLDGLRKATVSEYLVRFAFGGTVTAVAGLIAHAFGPAIGGLFLAFPAILPASLTLIAMHDGRRQAADDARGAILGAIALVAFAAVARVLAARCAPAVTLAAATSTWIVVAASLWFLRYGRRKR